MSTVCKNCGNIFEGNYCNNCGQKATTHDIDIKFIAHDLQHGLFHYQEGILYSIKKMFTNPGNTIRDYIEGKRTRHYKPLSMVIVLATLYGVLYHAFKINVLKNEEDVILNFEDLNEWIAHHFSIIALCQIPILSLSSYLFFKKQGYNYTEHLILNSFYSSQKIFLRLLLLPLFLLTEDTQKMISGMQLLMLVDLVLMCWTYFQFFNKMPKRKALLLTIGTALTTLVLLLIITTLILAFLIM